MKNSISSPSTNKNFVVRSATHVRRLSEGKVAGRIVSVRSVGNNRSALIQAPEDSGAQTATISEILNKHWN